MLNKPTGYVSSRRAQAQSTKTLYDLLPSKFKSLKTVGRLDKDTAGLILLTDDGDLAFQMTHPKFAKTKVYQVGLDKPLSAEHRRQINCHQVKLSDGLSGFQLVSQDTAQRRWRLTMQEGRNRQIRRTFAALGYTVTSLERTNFANYTLGRLKTGHWQIVPKS
jgi:23S rRNA pseudouridine2605 synthase